MRRGFQNLLLSTAPLSRSAARVVTGSAIFAADDFRKMSARGGSASVGFCR